MDRELRSAYYGSDSIKEYGLKNLECVINANYNEEIVAKFEEGWVAAKLDIDFLIVSNIFRKKFKYARYVCWINFKFVALSGVGLRNVDWVLSVD